jgi:hypothetical protein
MNPCQFKIEIDLELALFRSQVSQSRGRGIEARMWNASCSSE